MMVVSTTNGFIFLINRFIDGMWELCPNSDSSLQNSDVSNSVSWSLYEFLSGKLKKKLMALPF